MRLRPILRPSLACVCAALFAWLTVTETAPAAAETEAEAAARAESPLTAAERSRLAADCRLPAGAPAAVEAPPGARGRVVSLDAQTVLKLYLFYPPKPGDDAKVDARPYPYLPAGGIGARDFCSRLFVTRFPPLRPDRPMSAMGLRLRPGLDLAADYPTAHAEIVAKRQVLRIDAGDYLAVQIEDFARVDALAAVLGDYAAFDVSKPFLVMDRVVYFPLKPGHSPT